VVAPTHCSGGDVAVMLAGRPFISGLWQGSGQPGYHLGIEA
jgi:hypothetical protein